MKYTDEEMNDILKSNNLDVLGISKLIVLLYWCYFKKRKLDMFCQELNKGKSVIYAYRETINS